MNKFDKEDKKIQLEEISEEMFNKFIRYLKYSNYQLIKEGTQLYAVNIKTNEKIALNYDRAKEILNSSDKSLGLGFQLTDEQYQSVDIKNNKIIIIGPNSFQSCGMDFKYHIAIISKNDNYNFYYNKEKIEIEDEISIVIDRIRIISPTYYQELENDPNFKKIIDKINKHKGSTKEIYEDKVERRVKIVPEKKEKLIEKFRIFGYEILEKEDGIYAKDLKKNIEHKIILINDCCYFENIKPSTLSFEPNTTIVTDDTIIENNVRFKKENTTVRANQELSKFVITINNKTYKLYLSEDKLIYQVIDENDKKIELTEEEMLLEISIELPYLVEYIKNNIRNKSQKK